MKKNVLLIGGAAAAGLLLLVGAVIWLVPSLTYDTLPFLWTDHHKKTITERSNLLMDHLAKDDIDAAIRLADPAVVKKEGTDAINRKARVMSGIIRLVGRSSLRVEEVILGPDSKSAEVKLAHKQRDQWVLVTQWVPRWVRVDGVWYITF